MGAHQILNNIKLLFSILDKAEKKQAIVLLIMVIIMAALDTLGVASILPFMTVLLNQNIVLENQFLIFIYEKFEVRSINEFLIILGVLFFITLSSSILFKAWTIFQQVKFSLSIEYSLSTRLVGGYLAQSYLWLLQKNTSTLTKNSLAEVANVVDKVLTPIVTLLSQFFISAALVSFLFWLNPWISISIITIFGGFFGLIYFFVKGYLKLIGKGNVNANEKRFLILSEVFGGIREVKVNHLENLYLEKFSKQGYLYAKFQTMGEVVSQMPRFALEFIAFGGMILLIISLITKNGEIGDSLALLSVFAFAGYKLIPATQQVYLSLTQLSFRQASLELISDELKGIENNKSGPLNTDLQPLNFPIKFEKISFRYPDAKFYALRNISIEIEKNSIVGIVGETGSGKTTFVNILLGLLEPKDGSLKLGSQFLTRENIHSWQKLIGYVPQRIFISDDSIMKNIGFTDFGQVKEKNALKASKIAKIHDFVKKQLPHGYSTVVGEGGNRLSGGQIQRIGIARALYKNPKLLVLDEATSALDNNTESDLLASLKKHKKDMTVIMIAHRLKTLEFCDKIIVLKNGRIVGDGSFSELSKTNKIFQKMLSNEPSHKNAT